MRYKQQRMHSKKESATNKKKEQNPISKKIAEVPTKNSSNEITIVILIKKSGN